MRRFALICCALVALAAPAAALALTASATDGSLVVRYADNGDGIGQNARPIVVLAVSGFAIGHVSDQGRIQIFDMDSTDQSTPEVTGTNLSHKDVPLKAQDGSTITGTQWTGSDFRFRAVDGTYLVKIWGSGVYLFSSGRGTVTLTGSTTTPRTDGQYSLDGNDFASIPVSWSAKLVTPPAG